ncbi:MAG: imidazole glycerol phosphate synthase subunit HisH [Sphingomonadales bacterium]|nr:imidazole glycerol phosphate synthase subunit HisH [Sphingomonadales bacterium]
MIAVIDYGAGNLRNVCKSLAFVGGDILLTDKPAEIERADKVVLPGVGAFADCWQSLQKRDLVEQLLDFAHSGRPFLGICVGMQLLFDAGEEMGDWPGLGLIPGRVVKFAFESLKVKTTQPSNLPTFQPSNLKIPHIGWNQVQGCQLCHPVLNQVTPNGYAYFVHSYHAQLSDSRYIVTTTNYGYDFPSVVAKDNVWGIQFHPEKSQDVGLQMLKNFVEI